MGTLGVSPPSEWALYVLVDWTVEQFILRFELQMANERVARVVASMYMA